MESLKSLDLRTFKKPVCKISSEIIKIFEERECKVLGALVKETKGKKEKRKNNQQYYI